MAFKMKGSPIKLGKIQGTSGHASALQQHNQESPMKKFGDYDLEGNRLSDIEAEDLIADEGPEAVTSTYGDAVKRATTPEAKAEAQAKLDALSQTERGKNLIAADKADSEAIKGTWGEGGSTSDLGWTDTMDRDQVQAWDEAGGFKMKSPLEQNKEKFAKTESKAKKSDVQPEPVKNPGKDPQGPTDPSEFTFAMKSPLEQSYWEQFKKGAGDLYDEASQIGKGTAAWIGEIGRDQGGGYGRQKRPLSKFKEAYSAKELKDAVAKGDFSNVDEEDMRRAKQGMRYSPQEELEFEELEKQKHKDRRSKMTPAQRVAEDKQIEAETERKRLEQARLEAEFKKRADEEWEKI